MKAIAHLSEHASLPLEGGDLSSRSYLAIDKLRGNSSFILAYFLCSTELFSSFSSMSHHNR